MPRDSLPHMMDVAEQKHAAEMYSLAEDENLIGLLAWRLVKQRAEAGGFNGLLASDFTKARAGLAAMLDSTAFPKRMQMPEPVPMRGELPPMVEQAAHRIHTAVWGEPYRPLKGPMHYAGGSYWHDELLRQADRWERMAADARICAEVLPDA